MKSKRSYSFNVAGIGLAIALLLSGLVAFADRAEAANSLGIRRVLVNAVSTSEFNYSVIYGPDGNYWQRFKGGVRKIAPNGAVTTFANANVNAGRLTVGSDGNLWFANSTSIGRISTSGNFAFFSGTGINYPGDPS